MDKLDELIREAVRRGTVRDAEPEHKDIDMPPVKRDPSGTLICPGHPKLCLGSGDFAPLFECCCDECDSFLKCYPEHQTEVDEALENLRK